MLLLHQRQVQCGPVSAMNRHVSTKEALDILSALAPRPWCKKLLTSLMFEGALKPYASEGHLIGRVPILCLLDEVDLAPADEKRFWTAVKKKYGVAAPQKNDGKTTPRGTLFPITSYRWYPENGPFSDHPIGYGYFYYADSLDWEAGTLRIESIFPDESWRELFLDDDAMFHSGSYLAQPRFSWLEFEVELAGLCFERSAIEMLTGLEQPKWAGTAARPSRPRKWDWDGALAHVVAEANRNPDGLPDGYGAQASIEKLMLDWFVDQHGEAPVESELRLRAKRILAAVAEGRKD